MARYGRRVPQPLKLVGAGTDFPKQDLFSDRGAQVTPPPTIGSIDKDMPKIPGSHFVQPTAGGRLGIIRFPTGSKRFTKREINQGHRKTAVEEGEDSYRRSYEGAY